MPCTKCLVNPDYHSFKKFGTLQGKNIFYTAPAKTEDYNADGTKLTNIKIHVKEDTLDKPWIWVLDCQNMGLVHYTEMSFNIGLLQLLNETKTLDSVWIINPNIWISTTISFLRLFYNSPILNKITYLGDSKRENADILTTMGLTGETITWLLKQ
jgi:hypothetical protein